MTTLSAPDDSLVGRAAFDASDDQWSDWRWQMRHRLTTVESFSSYLCLTPDEIEGFRVAQGRFEVAATPYFVSLMQRNDRCAIRRQVLPLAAEEVEHPGDYVDPLGEDEHTVAPSLVRKYPDRVLFLPTDICAGYCRYCTRSRLVNQGTLKFNREAFVGAKAYVQAHPEIRDVLISGGDPLLLNTEHLADMIAQFAAIDHVGIVRIGTRVPAFLPQRITAALAGQLREAGCTYISVHFNHVGEITPEVRVALAHLADAGIVLGNQSVLLKGINNDAATLKDLFHVLQENRVTPYYLHQCDPVRGSAHLRTPLQQGVDIMRALRGHTSSYAVPTFAVDLPHGGGKIALEAPYIESRDGAQLTIRNYAGNTYTFVDVDDF